MRQPLTGPGLLATFALLVAACGGSEDSLRDDGSLRVDDDSLRVEAYFEAGERGRAMAQDRLDHSLAGSRAG